MSPARSARKTSRATTNPSSGSPDRDPIIRHPTTASRTLDSWAHHSMTSHDWESFTPRSSICHRKMYRYGVMISHDNEEAKWPEHMLCQDYSRTENSCALSWFSSNRNRTTTEDSFFSSSGNVMLRKEETNTTIFLKRGTILYALGNTNAILRPSRLRKLPRNPHSDPTKLAPGRPTLVAH